MVSRRKYHRYLTTGEKSIKLDKRTSDSVQEFKPFSTSTKRRNKLIVKILMEEINRELEDYIDEEAARRIMDHDGVSYEVHKGLYIITSPNFDYTVYAREMHDDGDYFTGEIDEMPGLLVTADYLSDVLPEAIDASKAWIDAHKESLGYEHYERW